MDSHQPQYLAVLGFSDFCSEHNKSIAEQVARVAAQYGVGICMGNNTGTFHYALKEMKYVQGDSLVVLEQEHGFVSPYCKKVIVADSTDAKHRLVAKTCMAAIVIGGAKGSEHLIDCVLQEGKSVVVMKGCGSLVSHKNHPKLSVTEQVDEAFRSIFAA